MEPTTVLFVDCSKDGELAKQLKELIARSSSTVGFSVKVVERTGRSLKNQFPLTTLWDGSGCGRGECITCTQGAEMYPPYTQRSVVYENVCGLCNEGAKEARELKESRDMEVPSIYVGESSRSIQERSMEHWADFRKGSSKSHILKHQTMVHGGEAPSFIM